MSQVSAYAVNNFILIMSDYVMLYESGVYIELCEIPSWIHYNEVNYILTHKRLNPIAQELIRLKTIINCEPSSNDIMKRYDELCIEAKNILSEIVSKFNNKCLISSTFLEQNIREYLEKNQEKYKTYLEFDRAFVCDLLAADPFHWYGFYYNDRTIRPLTTDDIIIDTAYKVWRQKFPFPPNERQT